MLGSLKKFCMAASLVRGADVAGAGYLAGAGYAYATGGIFG